MEAIRRIVRKGLLAVCALFERVGICSRRRQLFPFETKKAKKSHRNDVSHKRVNAKDCTEGAYRTTVATLHERVRRCCEDSGRPGVHCKTRTGGAAHTNREEGQPKPECPSPTPARWPRIFSVASRPCLTPDLDLARPAADQRASDSDSAQSRHADASDPADRDRRRHQDLRAPSIRGPRPVGPFSSFGGLPAW